eukprot:1821863-Rhodomonas_salina.1
MHKKKPTFAPPPKKIPTQHSTAWPDLNSVRGEEAAGDAVALGEAEGDERGPRAVGGLRSGEQRLVQHGTAAQYHRRHSSIPQLSY